MGRCLWDNGRSSAGVVNSGLAVSQDTDYDDGFEGEMLGRDLGWGGLVFRIGVLVWGYI